MSDELKPCPFCGNKDIQRYNYVNEKFRVTCRDCRNTTKDWDGVDDAIEKWNTRVDPSPKWTYCEDALPDAEESGYYFATRKTESGRVYTWQTHFSQELQSWSVTGNEQVIAWQPLPAPAEPKEAK